MTALQQSDKTLTAYRQHHHQHIPRKKRSQEALDGMQVPAVWPSMAELKTVLRDGSQISMSDGLTGLANGLVGKAWLHRSVSKA